MLTNYERETIITFNEAEADCEVYTYNQKLIRKLTERCESHPNLYQKVSEDQFGGYTFCFPKSLLTINPRVPINGTEQRLARLLFKVAVELGKLTHLLAAANDVEDETLRHLQAMCMMEVRKINGIIECEDAVRYQQSD